MEQTKTPLPPLVSDGHTHARCGEMRDIYEADRLKTREVVQALVDALAKVRSEAFANVIPDGFTPNPSAIEVVHIADSAMALAKSQLQIEPKP